MGKAQQIAGGIERVVVGWGRDEPMASMLG